MSQAAAPLPIAAVPPELEPVRRLTLRYLVASTAIFLASGLLGVILRTSQADLGRLDDNTWYALMTAHGLGAFLGWGAFAVMGFSWWVLAQVGLPPRRFGRAMAETTFWLMIVGVAGVLATTLLMGFAASWVFLYPLPFFSAGEWGDAAAGIFLTSVLLVGLSIVTWCVGILHTVVGPGLHAVRSGIGTRLGLALGLGYIWPKRFATNPRSVPYPVVPLTVIGIDMIIATLPLAVLLVVMIVKTFSPGVAVDPLLAKNILWFFGHPVVYLLLFPAVAILYYLVPRYAGRDLVAGNVVAVAWLVAVVVNVLIWGHHAYLDFPEGTTQAVTNTFQQPLTYLIVLPSALSIYSLSFTIFRSRFLWTAASTALFLAIVSWLLAGLSGIVNATIAFQETVHNTLWIVGHFHHMAFAMIGLVVIGAVYAFLPELVGKPLWSDRLGIWHVVLTFALVTANSALWLWQGLDGAPRRFSELPDGYHGLTVAGVPIVVALAAVQLLFVVNIVQTVRGRGVPEVAAAAPRRRRSRSEASAEAAIVLVALALMVAAGAAGYIIGRETAPGGGGGVPTGTQPAETTAGGAGAEVFASAGCGTCHTLSAAGSSGTVGPNLDDTELSPEEIAAIVREGRGGMPAFGDELDDEQIEAVAEFVAGTSP
jgi:cytochrome c oxidase subunit 1